MNLFRSEEHVRNWSEFRAGTDEGILPLSKMMALLSTSRHSAKFEGNYVARHRCTVNGDNNGLGIFLAGRSIDCLVITAVYLTE